MLILTKLIRACGVVLGIAFIVFPIWLGFATGGETIIWVQPLMGVIFLIYGIGGHTLLAKFLLSSNQHDRERNV